MPEATFLLESRMREICTSGSTRGGAPSGPLLLYRLAGTRLFSRDRGERASITSAKNMCSGA